MHTSKDTLEIFTPMRGLMMIYIILFHFSSFSFFTPTKEFFNFTTQTFFVSKGYIGVEFFFLLSVFVFLYQNHDTDLLTWKEYFNFQKKRFVRIYPLHIVLVFLFIPVNIFLQNVAPYVSNTSIAFQNFLGHLTLTHAWGWFNEIGFNVVAWYLSAQFFLYLIMPFLNFIYNSSKILLCVSALLSFMIFGYIVWTTKHPVFGYNCLSYFNQYSLLRAVTSMFFAGISFWIYQKILQKNIKTNKIFIISIICFIGYLLIQYTNPLLIPDVIIIPIFATLMIGLLFIKDSMKNLFMQKWLIFLGNISFPLFLIHAFFLRILLGFPKYNNLSIAMMVWTDYPKIG